MTRPIRSLLSLASALGMLLASRAVTAGTTCPADSMRICTEPIFTSNAAAVDSSITYSFGSYRVAYDLRAGWLRMEQCCSLAGAWVKTADLFDVAGVPAGTPVAVTALLTVDGSVSTTGCGGSGCGGYYAAKLEHGALADQVTHNVGLFSGSVSFHDVIQVPLTIVAGTPERIHASVWGARGVGGAHASEATGVLTFAGLPEGASIVSCQGYDAGTVPVRAVTWGKLKTLYR